MKGGPHYKWRAGLTRQGVHLSQEMEEEWGGESEVSRSVCLGKSMPSLSAIKQVSSAVSDGWTWGEGRGDRRVLNGDWGQ